MNEGAGLDEHEGEDRNEAHEADEKGDSHGVDVSSDGDELMEINGVKPDIFMEDGDEREVSSLTR